MRNRTVATLATTAFVLTVVAIVSAAVFAGEARSGGRGPGGRAPAETSELSKPPLAKDDAEKKILGVLDEMWGDSNLRFASVSQTDGRLLRQLAETAGAKHIVEIGTSTGYSGLWFAMALRKTGGKLVTHEIDPERAKMAQGHFEKAGVKDLVAIVEGDAHETVKEIKEPIDILFLDADKEGYIDYLNKLLPLVRPGGLILAHNMRRPRPDPRFITAITEDPNLDTTFLLMEGSGVSMTLKKR